MDPIRTAIRDYLLEEFLPGEDPEELSDDTPLITGGVLDSISTLKLVVYLEERFGISLEAHEAGVEHLDTVDRIAALVETKQSKAA
jgi:acyl carrier protein